MVFVTGDCHGEFRKFTAKNFPQQKELTKSDTIIVCGDFGGVWDIVESSYEKYWLDWLNSKSFTTIFVDGNHENFDRLENDYEIIDFHGAKAHKIRDSVFHIMRGEIFELEGMRFFAFGGASSHDISDGILSKDDFKTEAEFKRCVKQWSKARKLFRVEHESWWKKELPVEEEYENANYNLRRVNYKVDYVISHCAPDSIISKMFDEPTLHDSLTKYFESILSNLCFKKWFFGHYHYDMNIIDSFFMMYDDIIPVSEFLENKKDN